MKWTSAVILFNLMGLTSCDFTSPGTYHEISKVYSPDSSKYLLTYRYDQGAWDGGRTSFTTILKNTDSLSQINQYSFSSLDFDDIYWQGSDTIVVAEKFTEFLSQGISNLKDTVLNSVIVKVIQKDPIDTSYSRKIIYQETSPNNHYELYVYRYVKPVNGYYFLNISVVGKNDSIPKFGNFYISRFDFDCFENIEWDSLNRLDIKVSSSCYYAFTDYLVKNRPSVKYEVAIGDTIKGNIQTYLPSN